MARRATHSSPFYAGSVSTPVPDPTEKTTESLLREISSLREVLGSKIDGHREVLATRIDGMAKAVELLQVITDRQPLDVDRKVANLQKLHEEKFVSIQVQFTERDVRTEQTSRDSKVAVDAALQAAKEAVGEQNRSSGLAIAKSEAATGKQIDQLGALIQQVTKAMDDKIADIKERLGRIEGAAKGHGDAWGYLIGGIGIVAAVISIAFAITRHA